MASHNDEQITYFAETDSRNKRTPFGIKAKDRTRHVYVIGKTGMGKSTLLENMAVQDITNGNGIAFVDPHGKTADLLLDYVPEHRIKDVLYFAPFDMDFPISFNVMEDVGADRRHLVVSGLMSAFKKIWVDAWSARMEYILSNTILALLEYPGATLLGINRMLSDKEYRNKVVANIMDPSVKSFWVDEFAKYNERYMQEAGDAIKNKVGQFTANPLIRNIVGQSRSSFDIRKIMDDRKILIVNLSKGLLGEANANLLGSILITKMYLSAMSRADVSLATLNKLPNFYLYVDEFQTFANESFADILSEARKYKLNLTIAHQYIEQMPEEVRAAVFGNVGTMITFRVGAYDAEVLEKEFKPYFTAQDLVNLGFVQIYLKLMIDGISSQPFSAVTLPPIEKPIVSFKKEIVKKSRETFASPRLIVEEEIKGWHTPIKAAQAKPALPHAKEGEHATDHQKSPKTAAQPAQPFQQKPQMSRMPLQEKDIKKAILLGDLVPVESQPKKDDKGPKKESLNALRSALSSVLKETPKPESQKKETASVPVTENKIGGLKEALAQVGIAQKKQEPAQIQKPEPEKSKEQPIQNPPPVVEQKQSQREAQNEVPEEVLRKVLDIQE